MHCTLCDNLLYHNKVFTKNCSAEKIVSCLLFSCYTNKSKHSVLAADYVQISLLTYLPVMYSIYCSRCEGLNINSSPQGGAASIERDGRSGDSTVYSPWGGITGPCCSQCPFSSLGMTHTHPRKGITCIPLSHSKMLAIKSWLTALCILSARTKPLHYVASSATAPKSGLSVYINTTVIGVRAEEWGGSWAAY